MTERRRNVYENKGPVFHSPMESGNVIENKDSYAFKVGMLLKTQHVSLKSRVFSRPSLLGGGNIRRRSILAGTVVLGLLWSMGLEAQQSDSSVSNNTNLPASSQSAAGTVPRLIKFTGGVKDLTGKFPTGVVGLTFSLYELPEGGSPLWVETQSLPLDPLGRYTALLGASSSGGLPLDLFTAGKALWLGVQPQMPGIAEQPRVLLVAVPYALKAADADALGGKPASAFVTTDTPANSSGQTQTPATALGQGQAAIVVLPPRDPNANQTLSNLTSPTAINLPTLTFAGAAGVTAGGTGNNITLTPTGPVSGKSGLGTEGVVVVNSGQISIQSQGNQDNNSLNLTGYADGYGNNPRTADPGPMIGMGLYRSGGQFSDWIAATDGVNNGAAALWSNSGLFAITTVPGLTPGGAGIYDQSVPDSTIWNYNRLVITDNGHVGIGTGTLLPSTTVLEVGSNPPGYPADVLIGPGGATATDGFIFGTVGWNLGFDGTNWDTKGDGVANGGAMIWSRTDGGLRFTTVPSRGPGNQSIADSNISAYNRMIITGTGNVGIGTTTPSAALHVNNTLATSILLGQYNGTNEFRVDNTGKGFFQGGTETGGADFAESLAVRGKRSQYEPGDLLVIDPRGKRRLALSRTAYSPLVAGIYSTKPGVLATPHTMDDGQLKDEVPLAIVGIVPCKVTAQDGPIEVGDLLVSSSRPGYAMKGTDRSRMLGAVVGKALEPLGKGIGVIQVLVTLQ